MDWVQHHGHMANHWVKDYNCSIIYFKSTSKICSKEIKNKAVRRNYYEQKVSGIFGKPGLDLVQRNRKQNCRCYEWKTIHVTPNPTHHYRHFRSHNQKIWAKFSTYKILYFTLIKWTKLHSVENSKQHILLWVMIFFVHITTSYRVAFTHTSSLFTNNPHITHKVRIGEP